MEGKSLGLDQAGVVSENKRAVDWTSVPCGTETILLADDDRAVRMLTATILEKKGYTVLAVCDGDEALHWIQERPDDFDLLITDMNMPGINGQELALKVLGWRRGIKVLLVSGSMETLEMLEVLRREEDMRFLEKPYTPMALCLKVREVLELS
ncbi:response regulator [Granulicella sibirica]|uniref:Sensory box histidine kinase/response regulator n=1 Tax=Granulicella sibirica TaxID=2479048 RepID=A0A4Q0T126_9BACT|nr:response regulator [Granulicella sibirica]RXH56462.1 sensory box histidine kinase/response regulator [Granulicella sibirica]